MKYYSTRDSEKKYYTAPEAICKGLAPDGGLFVPEEIPALTQEEINAFYGYEYNQIAAEILYKFFPELGKEEIAEECKKAYAYPNFDPSPAPVKVCDNMAFLELWHGPTCAFKDMALQIMPRLLRMSMKYCGETRTAHIVTATSGDTGKAAMEGFKDLEQTRITVYYPTDGVSDTQKRQMATQEGNNVNVIAVRGNFDDAQSAVKAIFADEDIKNTAAEQGEFLSSANSINIARLVPQVAYYVSSYIDLVRQGFIEEGEILNVSVPTGNFGDILAGWIAKKMGIPLGRLVCASNKNRVLTDFFVTGVYDIRRPFYATTSPSMDILIASNLERLLCFDFGPAQTKAFMENLKEDGIFSLTKEQLDVLEEEFGCSSCDDESTAQIIEHIFNEFDYTIDTHTAAAVMGSKEKCMVVSTASPYKFAPAVAQALGVKETTHEALSKHTGTKIPAPLADIYKKEIRFTRVVDKADIKKSLYLQ